MTLVIRNKNIYSQQDRLFKLIKILLKYSEKEKEKEILKNNMFFKRNN